MYDPDEAPLADAGLFGLPFTPDDARLVIIPVPWDATTSYRPGTSRGPETVRVASHQLDLYDPELGEPWRAGIAMLPIPDDIVEWNTVAREHAERVIEVGGRIDGDPVLRAAVDHVNARSVRVDKRVYDQTSALLDRDKLVGVLGGDHSVPFGAIRAHAERGELGILHVDAHADLREAYEGFTRSHASIMYNVLRELPAVTKLVQVGIRDLAAGEAKRIDGARVITHYDAVIHDAPWTDTCKRIVDMLPSRVYISFDIDGLDPALCPNTGTPVPGGLSFREASALIREVAVSGRTIVGFDLNEVGPAEWDGNVGARVLYKLCGWALRTQA